MDANEKLNILYDMTEQQQINVEQAIGELKEQNERLKNTGDNLQNAVKAAVKESMSGTANTAQSAINDALVPMLQKMNNTINSANEANDRLNITVSNLGWKMALMAGGVMVAIIACAYLTVWWQRSELETINENIAQMDRLKGQVKIQNCNGLACVEVDTLAPVWGGDKKNIYILKGVKFK
jgi:hypothetical protein